MTTTHTEHDEDAVERTPTEARQGVISGHVLTILVVSTVLAAGCMLAFVVGDWAEPVRALPFS
ncbi:MAG: hypothetical protein NW203_01750 [Hyphomonadaceae bacterium]|nr:hypothetical protein [Hyphomonadaceae bacterium]